MQPPLEPIERASKQAPGRHLVGISFMVLAMLTIPLVDVCAKLLSDDFSAIQITWGRFLFHCICLIPFLLLRRISIHKAIQQPLNQLARGALLVVSTLCFFIAIRDNPIPNVLALLFVAPLVVTLLSPWLLKEPIGIHRIIATIVGFSGVILVLQPNIEQLNLSLLLGLLSGISYALYLITTRRLSGSTSPILTHFYTGLVGLVLMSLLVIPSWQPIDWKSLGIMAVMGATAASAHYLVLLACENAPASIIAPFNYVEIIGAWLLSYLIFGFTPSLIVLLGILVICASGLYVSWREWLHDKRAADNLK